MKIAVISSSKVSAMDLEKYLPSNTTEIVSLCENNLDESAKEYADANGILLIEFVPGPEIFDSNESRKRITSIIKEAEIVLVFWDGVNARTKFVIDECKTLDIPIRVYV